MGLAVDAAGNTVPLNTTGEPTLVGSSLEFIEDPDKQYELPRLLDGEHYWQEFAGETFSRGFSGSAWWLKFSVTGDSAGHDYLLLIKSALLEKVDVWMLQNGRIVKQYAVGSARPFDNRPVQHRQFVFPLPVTSTVNTQVVLRVESATSITVPLEIWPNAAFSSHETKVTAVQGMYIGAMALIALYSLLLFVSIRDINYLLYLAYVVPLALTALVYEGWTSQYLWPGASTENLRVLGIIFCSNMLMQMVFTRSFLKVPEMSPAIARIFDATLVASLLAWLAAIAGLPYKYTVGLVILLFFFVPTISLVAAGISWKKHMNTPAKHYLFARSAFFGGGLVLILGRTGVIPNSAITEAGIQIGSALEALLLSFALADRINQERALREEANRASITAQAESKAKSRFLASMSHEIRTPMNGILGMAHLLQDTRLNLQQQQYLDVIKTSGRTLLHLINDILDLSKVTAGRMPLEKINFSLDELLHETAGMFEFSAREKGLHIEVEIAPDTPNLIKADPTRLRQIVANFLSNAIKFTEAGSVSLHAMVLRTNNSDPCGDTFTLRFAVRDTGVGVPPDHQASVFEAFEQGDDSITRKYGGTGLGLNICKHLVRLMDGEIGVISAPGRGSEFWFTVAAAPADEDFREHYRKQPVQPEKSAMPAHVSPRPATVLVVEDNKINQIVVRGLLTKLSANPVIVNDGYEGLRYVQQHHEEIDLILMDCELPGMDGYECTRRIRAFEAQHQQSPLPIYALTAHAMAEHREKSHAAGMDGHLNKPIDLAALQRVLVNTTAQPQPTTKENGAAAR